MCVIGPAGAPTEDHEMTIAKAAAITPNTEAFELAVEAASDAAAEGDEEACKVLAFLLQRNDDFLIRALH